MAEELRNEEVAIETPVGKFRARGSDILTTIFGVAGLCGLTIIIYGGYRHDADAAEKTTHIVQAIKESNNIQRETLNAQREANCLARLSPEQKKNIDNLKYCAQLGTGR